MNIQYKRKNGITLISLVITIIVLIILATISLRYGFDSLDETQDSIIEGNLKMVSQTILEKYSQEVLLGNTDIEISSSKGISNAFFGEVYEETDDIVWMLNKDNIKTYDKLYYKISVNDLENLGIEDSADDQMYIVNYYTGEVWDYTNKYYSDGNLAYIGGSEKFSKGSQSFTDTTIYIGLNGEVIPEIIDDSTDKISIPIIIHDDAFEISKLNKNSISVEIKDSKIDSSKFDLKDEMISDDSKEIKYNIVFKKEILPENFENDTIKIIIASGAIANSEGEESVYTELNPFLRMETIDVVLADNLNIDLVPLESMGYPAKNAIIISSEITPFELNKVEFKYDYESAPLISCSENKIRSTDREIKDLSGIPQKVFDENDIGRFAWIYVFDSTVNGPVNIQVKDKTGEVRTERKTIKNVKETILEFNINNEDTDLMLPIWAKYEKDTFIGYVDWGDGEGNYLTDMSYGDTDDYDYSTLPRSNTNVPYHKYNSNGMYKVKISGDMQNYWSYDFIGEIIKRDTLHIYQNKVNECKNALQKIEQFGEHYNINSVGNKWGMDYYYSGCGNLKSLPPDTYNSFKNVTSFRNAFSRTSITEIPKNFFASAENVSHMYAAFSGCKNLKEVSSNIWGKDRTKFKSLVNVWSMFAACSNLEKIDNDLFNDFEKLEGAGWLFSGCSSLKRVGKIFKNSDNLTTVSGMFAGCSNLEQVDKKIFENKKIEFTSTYSNEVGTEYRVDSGLFSNCKKLTLNNIPPMWEILDKDMNVIFNNSIFKGIEDEGIKNKVKEYLGDEFLVYWYQGFRLDENEYQTLYNKPENDSDEAFRNYLIEKSKM